jgi:hypothetical protein
MAAGTAAAAPESSFMSPESRRVDLAVHRQSHRGHEPENTFGGVLSFLRRTYTRDLTGVDVAVTGIPLDLATTFRSGARLGPAAIRAATVQLNEKLFPGASAPAITCPSSTTETVRSTTTARRPSCRASCSMRAPSLPAAPRC